MVSRLVLGWGDVGERLVADLDSWSGSYRVVTGEESRVGSLRDDGVPASAADTTDPGALAEFRPVDSVLVVQEGIERATAVARAAREAFPDATILAFAGLDAAEKDRSALREYADRVVDGSSVVGTTLADAVAGEGGLQARELRRTIQSIGGPLAVVMHDNPDPDAIASGVALSELARTMGVEATPCYYGSINHQENRAMVNLLDLDLRRLEPGEDLSEFGGFALVDHSRPGVNDQLPPETPVDVVIDHHPPRAPVEATYIDLRSEVGATSTLLTDYLRSLGFEDMGGSTVATSLLYGIRIDTKDFTREVSEADFEAAARLLPHSDVGLLDRIESPDVTPGTFATLSEAIRNREVRGPVVASCVGEINDRDALAQAADRLLDMEGITTTLVYGYDDETVYASARARGTSLDLGETLRVAFEGMGSAGGHADMAGAQIPLAAVLARAEDGDRWLGEGEQLDPEVRGPEATGGDDDERITVGKGRLEEVVEGVVSTTFFETVGQRPHEVPDDPELPSTESGEPDPVSLDWDPDGDGE